jgi:hypothetical protein
MATRANSSSHIQHRFNYAAGTTSFVDTHKFMDDDPTGMPSDTYTIAVTVTDDDVGSDITLTPVTVYNITPTIVAHPLFALSGTYV